MGMELTERYALLMAELGFSQDTQLAAFANVTRGAVQQWKKAKPSATMGPIPAYAIAEKTIFEPKWLMIGEGPIRKQQAVEPIDSSKTIEHLVNALISELATQQPDELDYAILQIQAGVSRAKRSAHEQKVAKAYPQIERRADIIPVAEERRAFIPPVAHDNTNGYSKPERHKINGSVK